jgi:hypothetical protein
VTIEDRLAASAASLKKQGEAFQRRDRSDHDPVDRGGCRLGATTSTARRLAGSRPLRAQLEAFYDSLRAEALTRSACR